MKDRRSVKITALILALLLMAGSAVIMIRRNRALPGKEDSPAAEVMDIPGNEGPELPIDTSDADSGAAGDGSVPEQEADTDSEPSEETDVPGEDQEDSGCVEMPEIPF